MKMRTEGGIMKKLKKSDRGLTFCMSEEEVPIGKRYRYVIDIRKMEIVLIPDSKGTICASRKRSGKKFKPLFDLRSREVRELVAGADYMEVDMQDGVITVHVYKKYETASVFTDKVVSLSDVMGQKIGQIVLADGTYGNGDMESSLYQSIEGIDVADDDDIRKNAGKVYNIVSLFSGAGLFDKAWLSTGRFRIVYGIDFDRDVIETYQNNISDCIECRDIRTLLPEELPEAEVYSASPCCQDFSNANRRNTGNEKRKLVYNLVELVAANKPKVLVIENVPQMLSAENRHYYEYILTKLSDYNISAKIVEDSSVGGYSKRKRAIVIASRIGSIAIPDIVINPVHTAGDAIDRVDESWPNHMDITKNSEDTLRLMKAVPSGGNWRDIPKQLVEQTKRRYFGPHTHSDIYRRLKADKPAPTLCNFRKACMIHPYENRGLSVSEAASIMGLSKEFRFFGKLSAMQQMVSNGVTQAIGRLVAKTVLYALDREVFV